MLLPIHSWTPIAERMESLPLILAGPILRRTEPRSVTVWVALREERLVTLRVYRWDMASGRMTEVEHMRGSQHTVRLGERLHVVAVTACAAYEEVPLDPDEIYCYNLFFEVGDGRDAGDRANLCSPGVLVGDLGPATEVERLTYAGMPLPSFGLPATTLEHTRIFHGSCRKPHGIGRDALATLDLVLAQTATDARNRPQQLYMTGDQIYADDVATPLLHVLMDAAETLVGREELQGLPSGVHLMTPGRRTWAVRELAKFTTATAENQLLTRGEYLAMHLFAWSSVLWPAALPSQETVWRDERRSYPDDEHVQTVEQERDKVSARWLREERELADFRTTLPYARRALANIPTYMVCDDHDVTDDWYLDGAWCANVLGSPLGRCMVRNALYAYSLCQAWGNDPKQFAGPNGASFLDAVARWRGAEGDADAQLIAQHLGVPDAFEGSGSLPRTERALRWHYTVETPAYRMLVLDARTRRVYDQPHAAPGLLSEEALDEQIGAPIASDRRLTLLVAQTPVLGVDIMEKIQLLSLDHYAYDRESWSLNRRICQALLRRLRRFGHVVILSGDVHYGFGSTLQYWEKSVDGGVQNTATIVNFTSSALKNTASGTDKTLLTVAYPHLFHLVSRGRMPPIELFAWDEGTPESTNARTAAIHAVHHGALAAWWSVPREATLLRSPVMLLPAHGWPPHIFDLCPPDRRMRLWYLRDACQPADSEERSVGLGASLEEWKAAHHQETLETEAVLTGKARVGVGSDKVLEAWRLLESSEPPNPVRWGVARRLVELAQVAFAGEHMMQNQLEAGIGHLLHAALAHPELWAHMWSDGGLHIVGDANIGEIRFAEDRQVALQRLWWYPPNAPDGPLPATEYRAPLKLPAAEGAPTLP